jgi:hypothetical protein
VRKGIAAAWNSFAGSVRLALSLASWGSGWAARAVVGGIMKHMAEMFESGGDARVSVALLKGLDAFDAIYKDSVQTVLTKIEYGPSTSVGKIVQGLYESIRKGFLYMFSTGAGSWDKETFFTDPKNFSKLGSKRGVLIAAYEWLMNYVRDGFDKMLQPAVRGLIKYLPKLGMTEGEMVAQARTITFTVASLAAGFALYYFAKWGVSKTWGMFKRVASESRERLSAREYKWQCDTYASKCRRTKTPMKNIGPVYPSAGACKRACAGHGF